MGGICVPPVLGLNGTIKEKSFRTVKENSLKQNYYPPNSNIYEKNQESNSNNC
jgi:hypothetical protein